MHLSLDQSLSVCLRFDSIADSRVSTCLFSSSSSSLSSSPMGFLQCFKPTSADKSGPRPLSKEESATLKAATALKDVREGVRI